MTEREVSSERVSDDFVEQVAKEIAKHTYARCLPQMSDCEDWDAMEEADRKIYRAAADNILALRSSVKTVGVDVADTCDGVEQEAFEAWAKAAGHDMHEHPMHYLFLDAKTDAARQGWKAGITHARQRILSALEAPTPQEAPIEVTEDAVFRAMTKADDLDIALCDDDAREILTAALKGDRS